MSGPASVVPWVTLDGETTISLGYLSSGDLPVAVRVGTWLRDACRIDVEAHRGRLSPKRRCQRSADVAEANDRELLRRQGRHDPHPLVNLVIPRRTTNAGSRRSNLSQWYGKSNRVLLIQVSNRLRTGRRERSIWRS